MASANFIQTAYIAFFNRPADVPGMTHWLNYPGPDEDLLNEFAQSAEYLSDYAGLTNQNTIIKVYQNLFNRTPEPAGLNYWVAAMEAGDVTIANVAWEILNGAQNEDLFTILNKATAAQAFTDALNTPAKVAAYNEAGANGVGNEAKTWLGLVNDSDSSLAAAQAGINNLVQKLVDAAGPVDPGTDTGTIWIGGADPTIYGSLTGNDTFIAQTGQLTDNVILDGRGGKNTLEVTLRGDEAIAPTVKNVQHVKARVQDGSGQSGYDGRGNGAHTDNNVWDYATIDADRFTGVNVWENKNSRADLKIEDVRILNNQVTKDITIIFRESDPGHVDYAVYFDQSSLRNQTSSSGILRVALYDAKGAMNGNILQDNPYTRILFTVDGGLPYDIDFGVVQGTATAEDFRAALQDAINREPALAAFNITVTLVPNVTFMVPDEVTTARADAGYYLELVSAGHVLGEGFWATGNGLVPPLLSTQGRQDSAYESASTLVTSTVILDYVGRGSMGGDLVIGGLSVGYTSASQGVQQFDISVQRDSRLEVIASTNNTLRVVNLTNDGTYNYLGAYERGSNAGARYGDLKVFGNTEQDTVFGPKQGGLDNDPTGSIANQYIDGLPRGHHDNGFGFTDVQKINAGTFMGNLQLNAVLTAACVDKYMNLRDQAPGLANADNINFEYTLGSGNDVFQLAISDENMAKAGTGTREDFVLLISAGGGDDTITTAIVTEASIPAGGTLSAGAGTAWYNNQQLNANLTIDAGSGNNVINTMGSGDWTIKLGKNGSDTYYADNTGDKAVWVFNTADQFTALAGERVLNDLATDDNSDYILVDDGYAVTGLNGYQVGEMAGLHGLKLRVLYKDVSQAENLVGAGAAVAAANGQGVFFSNVVAVPTASGKPYHVTDLNINQAIKLAINGDPVLNKLLVAEDGPANTLVVTSLVDGTRLAVNDLQIEFAIPQTVTPSTVTAWNSAIGAIGWNGADLQAAREASFAALIDSAVAFGALVASAYDDCGPNPGSNYSNWYSPNQAAAHQSYMTAFANTGAADIAGTPSSHVSDNLVIVNGSTGDKNVIVLSTGANSNDVVKFEGFNNGLTTIVNFEADGGALGTDLLDFTSYGAKWLGAATLDINGWVDPNNGWSVVCDIRGPGGVTGAAPSVVTVGGALPNVVAAPPATQPEDWYNLNVGDKYITITRADMTADASAPANPIHWDTVYKVELWTVASRPVPGQANAYVNGAASPKDTAALIGFIDLGRDIDGYGTTDSILAYIDFIAG